MGHKDKKASHSTNDHYSRHRDNNRDESHHKKEDQQHRFLKILSLNNMQMFRRQKNSLHGPSKGIEAAKNRLKASLTTAISDLSHEQTSNGQASEFNIAFLVQLLHQLFQFTI
jgi:hypothetical protein